MFSSKTAMIISTCSLGIGVFIGRKMNSIQNGHPELWKGLKSENNVATTYSYVFPTAFAKTAVIPEEPEFSNDVVVPQKDNNVPANSNNINEIVRYGFPSLENIRSYEDFILSYDKRNRTANWVLEHLTPDKVERSEVDRSQMKFVEDESFHSYHRATNKDFQNSGYDRGHLAAAANHRHSKTAMSQTFILSNIAPQVGEGFNRDAWNNLEKYTRALARRNKNVYVCTGPLYLPRQESDGKLYVKYQVIGQNHVSVPTHFFKVLLIENTKGEKELMSFVLPNEALPEGKLKKYLVPVDSIERAAGLHFFDKVQKNMLQRVNAITSK